MKRILFLLIATLTMTVAQAQPGMGGGMRGGGMPMGGMPMGGMRGGMRPGMMPGMSDEKPFYEAESDSIVQACLYDLPFFMDTKTTEKFSKLAKAEYEEVCRSIHMSVVEVLIAQQIAANGGGRMGGMGGFGIGDMPTEIDQNAIRENVDKITGKYAKKYKKLFEEEELEQWNAIEDKRYGRGLGYLIAHVYDNTSLDF